MNMMYIKRKIYFCSQIRDMAKAKGKSLLRRIWRVVKIVVLVLFSLSILMPIVYRFVPPPFTLLMITRVFEQMSDDKEIKLKKDWVSIDEISPNVILAAVAAEDQNFLTHHGFDFKAIQRAMEYNQKGKKIRGASTISQQTAKNVFLWSGRTWIRKGLETYFTVLIEFIWNKERIMEVYLNEIEMGDGIYGIEKAANIYYNKSASKLSRAEAAMIISCLPRPLKWNPARPTNFLLKRQSIIMRNMSNIQKVNF